jgi:hypothetical protein
VPRDPASPDPPGGGVVSFPRRIRALERLERFGYTDDMTDLIATCTKDGCGRELSRVHDATGIDAEGRVGPLWTCKEHRTELWMKVGDGLVAPLEWWPD